MAIIDWDLHYDRRATAGFLAHFLHGGVAESPPSMRVTRPTRWTSK